MTYPNLISHNFSQNFLITNIFFSFLQVNSLIQKLEQSIAAYKDEYAVLISQAQAIKTDLENVQAKVDRSMALIRNLSIEKDRWQQTSDTFRVSK